MKLYNLELYNVDTFSTVEFMSLSELETFIEIAERFIDEEDTYILNVIELENEDYSFLKEFELSEIEEFKKFVGAL